MVLQSPDGHGFECVLACCRPATPCSCWVWLGCESMVCSPVVEATVDDGVVHGRTHGQPHAGQVDLLDELLQVEIWVDVGQEEEDVEGQPADGEGTHNHDHHFDHLGRGHSRPVSTVGWLLSSPCLCTVWVGTEVFIIPSSKEAERPLTLRLKDPGYSSRSVARDCHCCYHVGLVRN